MLMLLKMEEWSDMLGKVLLLNFLGIRRVVCKAEAAEKNMFCPQQNLMGIYIYV